MFSLLSAQNKECREELTQTSGWITSPDLDGDGLYDFNLNCSWVIEADENKVIAFRLLYLEITPTEDCTRDFLLVSIVLDEVICEQYIAEIYMK